MPATRLLAMIFRYFRTSSVTVGFFLSGSVKHCEQPQTGFSARQIGSLLCLLEVHVLFQEEITVAGRICCDSVGKLNAKSTMLEGSRETSAGKQIPLDLDQVPSYSLFPGQVDVILKVGCNALYFCWFQQMMLYQWACILLLCFWENLHLYSWLQLVAMEGTNCTGNKFVAKQIFQVGVRLLLLLLLLLLTLYLSTNSIQHPDIVCPMHLHLCIQVVFINNNNNSVHLHGACI